ncbi:MAG TPA: hypothetical protein VGD37_36510 [Kofleriaceae bacterium]
MAVTAYTAFAAAGCAAGGEDTPSGPAPAAAAALQPATTPAAECSVATSGSWTDHSFREQNVDFLAEFDATPSAGSPASAIDAVVGLGDHPAARFSDLAAIVRFNPAGMIDARDGDTYRAGRAFPYQAGQRYHVRIVVFLKDHTYGVLIRTSDNADDPYTDLGLTFRFRTDQAGITRMSHIASTVDSATGTLEVCGAVVAPPAPPPPGCAVVSAGEGLVSFQVPRTDVLDVATFTAQPSAPNLDAVIGLSDGIPTGFSDLATAVRFSPSGTLDARDGDTYRADRSQPYDLGAVGFRMVSDLTSHTYSVFAGAVHSGSIPDASEIARQYHFRTEQQAARHLGFLSAIVDGPAGSITICGIENPVTNHVAYTREGRRTVAPLPSDEAMISDGNVTEHVDASGHVLASLVLGGELATDAASNVFIARLTPDRFAIDSYTVNFGFRWSVNVDDTFPAGSSIAAIGATRSGDALVAIAAPRGQQPSTLDVWRFAPSSASPRLTAVTGTAVAFDDDQIIVGSSDGTTTRIRRYDATGQVVWTREFAGNAHITAIAADADHDIVFGGDLLTSIDFGGGVIVAGHPAENPPNNGFVVELSSTGAHIFSQRTGDSLVEGIAAGGGRIAVSSTFVSQITREHLLEYRTDGTSISTGLSTGLGELGRGDRVWMGPTGRVWWNLDTQWPRFPRWPYLIVVQE